MYQQNIKARQMNLNSDDILRLTTEFQKNLTKASKELPSGPLKISVIQDWMLKHHIEQPELLQLLVKKSGTGEMVEKKTVPDAITD